MLSTPGCCPCLSVAVLCSSSCDMMELRRRYQSLYIPSDFFGAAFTWVDAFPLPRPFQFGNYCNFHIMHKEVDPLVKTTAVLDPPDANHTYSAKVGPIGPGPPGSRWSRGQRVGWTWWVLVVSRTRGYDGPGGSWWSRGPGVGWTWWFLVVSRARGRMDLVGPGGLEDQG